MAEKEKPISKEDYKKSQDKYFSNLRTFSYGGVAGNSVLQKDLNSASISLEKLVLDMGLDEDKLEGFLKGTFSSDKGIQIASAVYSDKYESARSNLTISNLWGFYDEYATKYLGDLKEKAEEEINKFKDEEFGKIKNKYYAAQEIIKSKTSNFSEEQKKKAKEDFEKYDKIVNTLEILNTTYLRKYVNSVDEEADMRALRGIYSEKEEGRRGR
jgi:hypothetical protein